MLNGGREGLFEQGRRFQQEGNSRAALQCFLSCLLGLTHVQSFHSLPNCLHQIAELFIDEKNYEKALQFIQAEKMFYEVALIELTALQGSPVGSQEDSTQGSSGWLSQEELSEQALQAQDLERLAQICIMSKRPHHALEYSGKATKIHQRAFGNDHPITARSLELLGTVYAEIGKNEYSASLGQCVSALSKTSSVPESYNNTLNSFTLSDKDPDLWHKDLHPPSDTPKPKVINCKIPTSILKRTNAPFSSQRRKTERHVHFSEPEITVHGYDSSQSRPYLALLTCLFLLLSALGLALYCTHRRRPHRACEELQAALAVYLLRFKQILWGCWIWLTMQ
ncbi:nutritionally-regulated adipose and cardiac enriched protein homolog isoform 2-T2 [Clarias gariepinus]|uniref:nutritionally-regulated adipose and cardiac enriched protein homolog isoform X2 n=1 Tax=Clarias gariepinus TaxID=13013 RepID=UPI00234DE9D9|nr:nutritionally-regulated adipose and cardiac enriched protein homolog isoform X2 [Clarias gariepinus]